MKTDLTKMVLKYQQDKKDYSKCFEKISELVYLYPKKKYKWPLEKCSDFYTFFYPLIERIMNKFRDQNKSFEAYLNSYLGFNIKRFVIRQKKTEKFYNILDYNLLWHKPYSDETSVMENSLNIEPAARSVLKVDKNGKIRNKTLCKRFLYLVLKNSTRISPEMKAKACTMMDMKPEELDRLIESLDLCVEKRMNRFRKLSEKRNIYVSKIYENQQAISREIDQSVKDDLNQKIGKLKIRLNRVIREICKVKTNPTYREIADALSTPKGTVDSGVFYLKSRLSDVLDKKCS